MFNVGGPEVLVILLVALIVLGPQQLPKAMRSVGNAMSELRRLSSGFQEEIRSALDGPIEADAREEGSKLARRPEDADITETVARNASEANEQLLGDHPPAHLDPENVPAAGGATASALWSSDENDRTGDGDWIPSDRASG